MNTFRCASYLLALIIYFSQDYGQPQKVTPPSVPPTADFLQKFSLTAQLYIQSAFVAKTTNKEFCNTKKIFRRTETVPPSFNGEKKEWTVLIYMAADNDLYVFANQNIAQMKELGSNDKVNILVHLDIKVPGKEKVTKLLYIEKNHIFQIGPDTCLNSGSDETFSNAVLKVIKMFPSHHLSIILWNHGSGDLNPRLKKTINPAFLFRYNPANNMIELDRSIGFIDFIDELQRTDQEFGTKERCQRGICFDETHRSYLDDTKLMKALTKIKREWGKNIDLIIFDACLMAGTGTAWIMSQFADYMVASEEVVLGPGYNYKIALSPFATGENESATIATSIVKSYETTYSKMTADYTHSALNLHAFQDVAKAIDNVAKLLIEGLENQDKNSVKTAIRTARSRYSCTHFDEPSYIDLYHFLSNLRGNIDSMTLASQEKTELFKINLKDAIAQALSALDHLVLANVCGANLAQSHGLSTYFPEFRMNNPHHDSYKDTEFARHSRWLTFLQTYHR